MINQYSHFTTAEVAEMLGVSKMTLSRWRREGVGPVFVHLTRTQVAYPKDLFFEWWGRQDS